MNQKGSSLLVVLVIIIVFSILGLAIISAAVNTVKRTEIRELEINTTSESQKIMSEILSKIQDKIKDPVFINAIDLENITSPEELLAKKSLNYDNLLSDLMDGTSTSVKEQIMQMYNGTDKIVNLEIKDVTKYPDENISDYISGYTYNKDKFFTRIYKVHLVTKGTENNTEVKRTFEQRFILSPTPSFLQYAVGSGNDVIINGSPDIIGDVYTPNLTLNSRAEYYLNAADIDSGTPSRTGPFYGPAIYGTLFTKNVINNKSSDPFPEPFFEGTFNEKSLGITGIPNVKPLSIDFNDMKFEPTLIDKWEEANVPSEINSSFEISSKLNLDSSCSDPLFKALKNTNGLIETTGPTTGSDSDLNLIINADNQIKGDSGTFLEKNPKFTCGPNLYLIEEAMLETYDSFKSNLFTKGIENTNSTLYFTNLENDGSGYKEEDNKQLVLDKSLKLINPSNEKGWLVVNGNLVIKGGCNPDPSKGGCASDADKVVIEGNIIVNGNLYILPNGSNNTVFFNSTAYVSGISTIDGVNIHGAVDETDPDDKPKQLVLISKGDLIITKINEYDDVSDKKSIKDRINQEPNLKGVFYTDNNATLYGVGSKFEIDGGVFAKNKLTINAIRYNFSSTDISGAAAAQSGGNPDTELNSRFYVEYDKKVILDQLNSLPRVNHLQIILDDLIMK